MQKQKICHKLNFNFAYFRNVLSTIKSCFIETVNSLTAWDSGCRKGKRFR